tara:strand:+ start:72 stop:335 length:264 start_codon:yes stop_codon:yes gene_type:complete
MKVLVAKILPFKELKFERVKTYILRLPNNKEIRWYDNGRRPLNVKTEAGSIREVQAGDIIEGVAIQEGFVHYRKCKPSLINEQLTLL